MAFAARRAAFSRDRNTPSHGAQHEAVAQPLPPSRQPRGSSQRDLHMAVRAAAHRNHPQRAQAATRNARALHRPKQGAQQRPRRGSLGLLLGFPRRKGHKQGPSSPQPFFCFCFRFCSSSVIIIIAGLLLLHHPPPHQAQHRAVGVWRVAMRAARVQSAPFNQARLVKARPAMATGRIQQRPARRHANAAPPPPHHPRTHHPPTQQPPKEIAAGVGVCVPTADAAESNQRGPAPVTITASK